MSSEKFSGRDLVAAVAGPRSWSDTRESWLARAARRAGISYRQTKALFYEEITDSNHRSARLLRDAAERLARVAAGLQQMDPEFHHPSIVVLLDLARRIHSLEEQARAGQGNAESVPPDAD